MEEKLSIGQASRNRDGTEVEELCGNGGVVLEASGDDVGMDFVKPSEVVTSLQNSQDGFGC